MAGKGRNTKRKSSSTRRKARDESFDLISTSGNVVFRTPPTHTIRRSTTPVVLTKGVSDNGYGQQFEAAQVINWSEISALYDQYCIEKVQYVFELVTPFIQNAVYPYVAVAPDYTDITAPISAANVLELAQVKVFQFSPDKTKFQITLKPRPAMQAFAFGVTPGYSIPSGDTWFATADSTVDHYGLKIWVNDYNSTISNVTAIRAFAIFHFKVRSTR